MIMRISERGVDFIKEWEGCELTAYLDVASVPTIGYGHTRTVTQNDVAVRRKISAEDAEALLREDLKRHEMRVNNLVTQAMSQNEFDALVSFDFNTGGLARSTALARLNRGDRIGAAEALTWWNKATVKGETKIIPGLANRRKAEKALFLTPAPAHSASQASPAGLNVKATPLLQYLSPVGAGPSLKTWP
jgi:lysozyme